MTKEEIQNLTQQRTENLKSHKKLKNLLKDIKKIEKKKNIS